MNSSISSPLLFGALLAAILWFVQFSFKWRKHRAQYKDLPCPPHSFWLGHLKILGEAMAEIAPNAHPQGPLALISEKYNLGNVFYIDLWPASDPFMIIQDPEVAAQITQTKNLPKHPLNKKFLRNLTGEHSIVTAEGAEWKSIRSMINPGFSPQHLSTIVPQIVDQMLIFRDRISDCARKGDVILMQDFAANAALDTIAQILSGKLLNAQMGNNHIADAFSSAISWAGSGLDPIGRLISKIPLWWYCRKLDIAIGKVVRERHATHGFNDNGQKVIVDLALQAYKEQKFGPVKSSKNTLDPKFVKLVVNNIKTLLLGGHDTTASALSYTLCHLSTHPAAMATIRAEHDSVFTPDSHTAARLISADPKLLSVLPFTTACIRESLRLFPPANTVRGSTPNTIQIVTYNSSTLPLANHGLWVSHYGIGRRADLWPDPLAFHPERFLSNHADYNFPAPPKDAFRSFEKGPRGCAGQELAMMELKIMLVLVCREFDFQLAYPKDAPKAPDAFGGQHYQILEFAPKPAGHMPMRARRRGCDQAMSWNNQ